MLRNASLEDIRALTSDQGTRSLLLRSLKSELILYIPVDLWTTAELVRDDFKLATGRTTTSVSIDDLNEIELLFAFLRHSFAQLMVDASNIPISRFVKLLFITLHTKYLDRCDPHTCLHSKLETMEVKEALAIYYDAFVLLQNNDKYSLKSEFTNRSVLLCSEVVSGRAKALVIFGGQGNTENLLEELIELVQVYGPLCRDFLASVTKFLVTAAEDPVSKDFMARGFHVMQWIDDPQSRPSREYLFSAAVSLPLVGLIQLLNYFITCKILGLTPGQLCTRFVGATGHSQGIVAAAVVSASSTEAELIRNTEVALHVLFWIGLRSQQTYPESTLNPNILADSLANGEGRPTPMLAVTKLTLPVLEKQVDISNKFLGPNEQIEIALHNGPRAYVCSGPPKSLYGNFVLNVLSKRCLLDGFWFIIFIMFLFRFESSAA